MSVHYSSAVWCAKIPDPIAKLVLLKLADNANDAGKSWPSIAKISEETGLCRRTVQAKIRLLEGWKLVNSNRGLNKCDYTLDMEKLNAFHPKKGAQEMHGAGDARCISRRSMVQEMHGGVQEMHLHIENRQRTVKEPSGTLPFVSPEFAETWNMWLLHRKEMKKPVTQQSAKLSLNKLAKMTEQEAIDAITHSIRQGWQGIYPPTNGHNTRPTSEQFIYQKNGHTLRPFD